MVGVGESQKLKEVRFSRYVNVVSWERIRRASRSDEP